MATFYQANVTATNGSAFVEVNSSTDDIGILRERAFLQIAGEPRVVEVKRGIPGDPDQIELAEPWGFDTVTGDALGVPTAGDLAEAVAAIRSLNQQATDILENSLSREGDAFTDEIPVFGSDDTKLKSSDRKLTDLVRRLDDITSLSSLNTSALVDGQQFSVGSYLPDTSTGPALIRWRPDLPKSRHDGVLFFSLTVPMFTDPNDTQDYRNGVGETDSGGNGVMELIQGSIIYETTVTVGAGGTYPTINKALDHVGTIRPANSVDQSVDTRRSFIEIKLLSGFVMAEQVLLHGTDFSHIYITSEDAEVTISKVAMTEFLRGSPNVYPAFGALYAKLPIINALFSMDSSGTTEHVIGVAVGNLSFVQVGAGAGVKNAGWRGLYITNGSTAYASESIWDGAGSVGGSQSGGPSYCVRISSGGASLTLRNASAKNGANHGVSAFQAGTIIAERTDVSGCAGVGFFIDGCHAGLNAVVADNCDVGLECMSTAYVHAEDMSATGCRRGINALKGSTVYAADAILTGCTERAISANEGSVVTAPGSDVTGCTGTLPVIAEGASKIFASGLIAGSTGTGSRTVYALDGSEIAVGNSTITGSNGNAIEARNGSRITAEQSDLSGAATRGAFATRGSQIDATGANCRIGASDDPSDIVASGGAMIFAFGAIGGTSITPNTPTSGGLIFQ